MNSPRTHTGLASLSHAIAPELRQGLEILLSAAPDPASAVRRLERFCVDHPSEFQQAAWTPFGLQALVAVFSSSNFLSDALQENPAWLLALLQSGWLHRVRTRAEVEAELEVLLPGEGAMAPGEVLAAFRKRQLLRILLRDVLGFAALPEITEELSNLADAILDAGYRLIRRRMESRFGAPRLEGSGETCGFSVVALGKLGGRELNYSSDIDLMFIHAGPGFTDGDPGLTNREFFKKVSNQLTELMGAYTSQGMIYRVDLRLRPEGRLGEVCLSVDGARDYYERRARDWELQMLIKARARRS